MNANALSNAGPVRSDPATQPKRERLLRLPEVEARCGIKKSTIYALMKRGEFPACVQCGARAVAWPESRIDGWIAARLESAGSVQ